MSVFGKNYSKVYDVLYKKKNYNKEFDLIHNKIKKHNKNCKNVLELGCGTGQYTKLFCQKNMAL